MLEMHIIKFCLFSLYTFLCKEFPRDTEYIALNEANFIEAKSFL